MAPPLASERNNSTQQAERFSPLGSDDHSHPLPLLRLPRSEDFLHPARPEALGWSVPAPGELQPLRRVAARGFSSALVLLTDAQRLLHWGGLCRRHNFSGLP